MEGFAISDDTASSRELTIGPACSLLPRGALRVKTGLKRERDLADAMLQLSGQLGLPLRGRSGAPLIDRLIPREPRLARHNTFSGTFGTGSFPLHTDTAHWLKPARYVVLGAARASSDAARTTITTVPCMDQVTLEHIAAGIFVVASGRGGFLGSICQKDRPFCRFDPLCMRPVDRASEDAMRSFEELISGQQRTMIQWSVGDVVILDNWSVLHGRSAGTGERVLLRLYSEAR
jgi:hypothetical protein